MIYKAENLCKSYQQKPVLQNLSFSVKSGERILITGPSGCGKTTLCRILAGLEQPDNGTLTGFSGAQVSMVFQEDRLIRHLSALENVLLVVKKGVQTKEEARAALSAVGLTQQDIQKPVARLSGGQKRRAAIVRALLAPGEVLILDEPFKGLDGDTRTKVIDYVKKMQRGRTLFLVTHEAAETEAMGGTPLALSL